jgi:hypothetical protein
MPLFGTTVWSVLVDFFGKLAAGDRYVWGMVAAVAAVGAVAGLYALKVRRELRLDDEAWAGRHRRRPPAAATPGPPARPPRPKPPPKTPTYLRVATKPRRTEPDDPRRISLSRVAWVVAVFAAGIGYSSFKGYSPLVTVPLAVAGYMGWGLMLYLSGTGDGSYWDALKDYLFIEKGDGGGRYWERDK